MTDEKCARKGCGHLIGNHVATGCGVPDCGCDEFMPAAVVRQIAVVLPPAVKIALRVILSHVQPGWENCVAVVTEWLEGRLP